MATKYDFAAIVIIFVLYINSVFAIDYGCPVSSKMTVCHPKCKDDSECHGKKCCLDICNGKSCVPDHLTTGENKYDGYKNKNSKAATGSYCGNVKCNSYEKCEIDRSTNKQKCSRH